MASKLIDNERTKLLASAVNAIGLAFVIGGFVAPVLAGQASLERALFALLAAAVGVAFHAVGQFALGRLRE